MYRRHLVNLIIGAALVLVLSLAWLFNWAVKEIFRWH